MKNKEIIPLLNGIQKLDSLKLGGIELKAILKNKKSLLESFNELEEVRKNLVDQYKIVDESSTEVKFTPENQVIVEEEWRKVSESDITFELIKLNEAKLDQYSDLTLSQMEVLLMMC